MLQNKLHKKKISEYWPWHLVGKKQTDLAMLCEGSLQSAFARSATNRYYYSAFRAVKDCCPGFTYNPNDSSRQSEHMQLINFLVALNHENDSDAIVIANHLRYLFGFRVWADYDNTDQIENKGLISRGQSFEARHANNCHEASKEVFDLIKIPGTVNS